jgi:hypothetical protein
MLPERPKRRFWMKPSSENGPIHHIGKIKAQMRQFIHRLREDVGKVAEPQAQA